MAKIIALPFAVIGGFIGGPLGAKIGGFIGSLVGKLIAPKPKGKPRAASAASMDIGEVARQAIFGRVATAGSLVDAFNYGGKYGTDWEVLVIALADHRCAALEGYYLNDTYVAFVADGMAPGYNNQLAVYWRSGTETQSVPAVLLANQPGCTVNDNGAGVCYAVVAYKADAADAKNPVWTAGRPRFRFIVRGAYCYDSRKDTSIGGAGAHRRDNPATWEYSDNPIVTRYGYARGIYACDRVTAADQLLVGRGLTAVEAPPANVFARANLCDEIVDGIKRYRIGGIIESNETYIDVENDFAAACAGTITQSEGAVEIDPGQARAAVVTITDDDLLVGSKVRRRWFLGTNDKDWINTVVANYIEPSMKWTPHAAPVRRDIADIIADKGPREETLSLGFVSVQKQAGRIGEVVRRLGRLQIRAEITLPPRFCELEEGDWIIWQSDRYFNGQAFTFRIDAWGSDKKWHHSISMRQISASCYSDTAAINDGSVAVQQPVPPEIGAPLAANWTLTSGSLQGGGVSTPALILTGASDDRSAAFMRVEYVQGAAAPTAASVWNDVGIMGPDIVRREIAVAAGGIYRVALSFIVDGVQGDRLILGPVTAAALAYPNGTAIENLMPGEGGATAGAVIGQNLETNTGLVPPRGDIVTPEGIAAGIAGQGVGATAPGDDVLNYNEQVGQTLLRAVGGGALSIQQALVTGAIKITLPLGYANTMLRFTVDIFDYATDRNQTYFISGYPSGGRWNNVTAQMIGREPFSQPVYFGFDGIKCCIWIGTPTSTWRYPRVFVKDLIVAFSNFSATQWKNGWLLEIDTVAARNDPPGNGTVLSVLKPRAADAVYGENVFEAGNGAVATLANFRTNLGIAGGYLGQTAWGTYVTTTPAAFETRTQYLSAVGAFSAIDRITNRRLTLLRRADNTTAVAEADVVTSLGISSAVIGQTSWATFTGITTTNMTLRVSRISGTTGRVTDPTMYNSQLLLGPRNTTSLNPTYTVNATNVTINLPAHSRKVTGPSGPITLSYGAMSAVVAFNTYWTAYVDDPNLTGIASPTVTITSNPDDLLFPGRYQVASGVAPNSAGTGGGTGSGGGGGGGFEDCVAADSWMPDGRQAESVCPDDLILALDDIDPDETKLVAVTHNKIAIAECVELTSATGIRIVISIKTPCTLYSGETVKAPEVLGHELAVLDDQGFRWERIVCIKIIGPRNVSHISCNEGTYAAGAQPGRYIFTHNAINKP